MVLHPLIFDTCKNIEAVMTARQLEMDFGEAPAPIERKEELRQFIIANAAVSLNVETNNLFIPEQIHGDGVAWVHPGDPNKWPAMDALIAKDPGMAVGVFTADCVPILIADRRVGFVAAVHAGREGTRLGLIRRVFEEMKSAGSYASSLYAWIGPSISQKHYEVSEETCDDFRQRFPRYAERVINGRNLNLAEINRLELLDCGVPERQIESDERCTFEYGDLFFSYRRDGERVGRMLSAIVRTS
jgi:YfiH family protein